VHKDTFIDWTLAEEDFDKIGELLTPYRWRGRNDELGEWILDVRKRLENGEEINLQKPCIELRTGIGEANQIAICKSLLSKKGESIVAIQKWRQECYRLAGRLRNTYISMETVDCQDLQDWCDKN